jgi:nucleolar protein 15
VKRKAKKAAPADKEEEEQVDDVEPTDAQATKSAAGSADAAETQAKAKGEAKTKKKTKARRLEEMQAAADEEPAEPRGVIYVGHIPDGFAEPQMKKFFGQFGKVTRLRLSRSKKNAASKGYAFIEFEEEGVAKIVAETMHKYLLFGKSLVCHMVEKEKQHPMLWKGCKRRMRNYSALRRRRHRTTFNDRPKEDVDGEKLPLHTTRQAERRKRSDTKLKALLANLDISYDMEDVAAEKSDVPAGKKRRK